MKVRFKNSTNDVIKKRFVKKNTFRVSLVLNLLLTSSLLYIKWDYILQLFK